MNNISTTNTANASHAHTTTGVQYPIYISNGATTSGNSFQVYGSKEVEEDHMQKLAPHIWVGTSVRGRRCVECGKNLPKGALVMELKSSSGVSMGTNCVRCVTKLRDEVDILTKILELETGLKLALLDQVETDPESDE